MQGGPTYAGRRERKREREEVKRGSEERKREEREEEEKEEREKERKGQLLLFLHILFRLLAICPRANCSILFPK